MSPANSQRIWRQGPHGGVGELRVSDDDDATELAVAFGQRLEDGHTLGADGQAVGGVLDVAAGDDLAVGGFESRADLEPRVVGERALACSARADATRASEPANDALEQRDELRAHAPRRLHHFVVVQRLRQTHLPPCS